MSFGSIAVISCAATAAAGIAATQPLELRRNRWWRIGMSLPLVVLIASAFYELSFGAYFALWAVAFLAFLWMGPMAHAATVLMQNVLHGNMNRPSGVVPDFGAAKALRKHGDWEEAVALTLAELEKEPLHYEGLLLLAGLYNERSRGPEVLRTVATILENSQLTADQRRFITQLQKELREEYAASNSGRTGSSPVQAGAPPADLPLAQSTILPRNQFVEATNRDSRQASPTLAR